MGWLDTTTINATSLSSFGSTIGLCSLPVKVSLEEGSHSPNLARARCRGFEMVAGQSKALDHLTS